MTDERIIFPEDPEAAQKITVEGWVSRGGLFYGNDERAARYRGCTHVHCSNCGEPAKQGYLICPACIAKKEKERFDSLPKVKWDGVTPICIYGSDQYFFDGDELDDYLDVHDLKAEDLMLVLCNPVYPQEIGSAISHYEFPEECDPGPMLEAAVDQFDKAIRKIVEAKEAMWWEETNIAVTVEEK